MMKLLIPLLTLPFLVLTACDATSDSVYRPSKPVEEFEAQEQKAEFQNVQFNPSVDILFVIDDSASMDNVIKNLSTNIDQFVQAFASHDQIDFHLGVVRIWDSIRYKHSKGNPDGTVPQFVTDDEGNRTQNFWEPGELIPIVGKSSERYVKREEGFTEILRSTLKSIKPQPFVKGDDQTPGVGPRFEELFSPVLANLKSQNSDHPLHQKNKGFWRDESHKVFVFITDADDVTPEVDEQRFDTEVQSLIGGDAKDDYSYYAVMHTKTNSSCKKDEGIRGLDPRDFKLTKLLVFTSGTPLDICSNFGGDLAKVGEEIRQRTLSKVVIPLQRYPEFFNENPDGKDKDWLEVKYGEQKIPLFNREGWGWSWDPDHNLLVIRGIDQMEYQEGAEFSVDFTALRLSEE